MSVLLDLREASTNGTNGFVRLNGVIMYANNTTPPFTWLECIGGTYKDINNDTQSIPDLRGEFVAGHGVSLSGVTSVGGIGGSEVDTLIDTDLPGHNHSMNMAGSHTHNWNVFNAGDHTHAGTTDLAGDHTHVANSLNSGGTHIHTSNDISNIDNHNHNWVVGNSGTHNHAISISDGGDHDHDSGQTNLRYFNGYFNLTSVRKSPTSSGGYFGFSNSTPASLINTNSTFIWNHTHNVDLDDAGIHSHTYDSGTGAHSHTIDLGSSGSHNHNLSFSDPGHNHNASGNTHGDHGHASSVSNSAGGHFHIVANNDFTNNSSATWGSGTVSSFPIVPPFYMLKYIIRANV